MPVSSGLLPRALRCAVLLLALCVPTISAAQELEGGSERWLAEIRTHTADELLGVLRRADELLNAGEIPLDSPTPVVFVLHGREVTALLRQNYSDNRELVDIAARLSALGVVKVEACETWMGANRIQAADLHPFIGTVANGVATRRELQAEGYAAF